MATTHKFRRGGGIKILYDGEFGKLSDDVVLYSILPYFSSKYLIKDLSLICRKWTDWIRFCIPMSIEYNSNNNNNNRGGDDGDRNRVMVMSFVEYCKKGFMKKLHYLELKKLYFGLEVECLAGDLSDLETLIVERREMVAPKPEYLTKLKNLRVLNVGGCYFPESRDFAFLLELKNSLTSLKCSFVNEHEQGEVIENTLKNISKLTKVRDLSMDANNIEIFRLDSAKINHLVNLTELDSLSLEKINMDNTLQIISTMNSLTSLSLRNCNITCEGCNHIAKMSSLKSLDITDNEIGELGCKHLSTLPNLTRLTIENANYSGLKHLIEGLQKLEYLSIRDKKPSGLNDPTNYINFSKLKYLTYLNASNTGLSGMEFTMISRLENLRVLDLSNSKLSRTEICEISKLPSLTELDISHSEHSIDSYGWDYLSQISTLKKLQLKNKCVDLDGIKYLKLHNYLN
ncbi:predicted protein [Naegleria gruberi]|uniref:Predicted protein n=1 Tax=Naegleria gruberi TaxID=5762 RepID=D2VDD5_NAEGR|nr:uncharacterized protein NAEGRDRAFT_66804 [Naegleria gruberi]EFC45212.1 predicted protein [Naegleria gruberi]|eukprot:XP_002677956.1 predicted protein [Naegleria gruberi strain NEG-M]